MALRPTPGSDTVALRRSVSLWLLTFYGLGNILGAGIYVLVGKVAGAAGYHAPLAFVVALLITVLTALSYSELAGRLPYAAGEAVYIQRAFGRPALSAGIGALIALAGLVSAAALARGFASYLEVFVDWPAALSITTLVMALGAIAAWGVRESMRLAAVITVIEIGGLALILWTVRAELGELPGRAHLLVPGGGWTEWQGILLGAFLAFYAFIGFEDMVKMAEEVRRPARNMPLAILLALGAAAVLYILVAVGAVLAVAPEALAQTTAPLALVYREASGAEPRAIAMIALFATVNGVLAQIMMAARVLYGMSRQGWLPGMLGRVHPRTRTPFPATVIVTAAVLALALMLPVVTLAGATSLLILMVFALVNLSLWRIKRRGPAPAGVRTWPLAVPALAFLANSALIGFAVYAAVLGRGGTIG